MTALDDDVLIQRSLDRDEEAFAALVGRYQRQVYWLVRRMMGEPEVEDLTQEVFIRAYQALPRFRGDSKFSTWLYTVARNLCLSELRKRSRRGETVSLDESGEDENRAHPPLAGDSLQEEIERRDLSRSVRELMDRLPPTYRTALTLYHLNQARYEEIAEIMDVPLGTVKTTIHRARLRLRDLVLARSDLAAEVGRPAPGPTGEGGSSDAVL